MTAITFVALGTSLPDLFASKQAAKSEKTADNSIGNVTGSNSVNVFLGLGLPWTIAAIYWTAKVSVAMLAQTSGPITEKALVTLFLIVVHIMSLLRGLVMTTVVPM